MKDKVEELLEQIDDLEAEIDELRDSVKEVLYNMKHGIDLKNFIYYLKQENLYTEEMERFIFYYNRCHNEQPEIDIEGY